VYDITELLTIHFWIGKIVVPELSSVRIVVTDCDAMVRLAIVPVNIFRITIVCIPIKCMSRTGCGDDLRFLVGERIFGL